MTDGKRLLWENEKVDIKPSRILQKWSFGERKTTYVWEKTNIQHQLLSSFSKCQEYNGGQHQLLSSFSKCQEYNGGPSYIINSY